MKKTAWFLTLLGGGFLFYALGGLPQIGDPFSAASVHVSSRYIERGALETGQHNLVTAVLSDYRSFDLWILSLLILTAGGAAVLLRGGDIRFGSRWGRALGLALLGPGLCLLVGLGCMIGGENFLDYESLPLPVAPGQVRAAGSLLMEAGILLSFLGFLSIGAQIFSPEGRDDHEP